ncbi:hypothetical protein E4U41_005768 [Claviceps citrina]|nr:hypothetical protein E4U41_005768 [Claviceps citrina]
MDHPNQLRYASPALHLPLSPPTSLPQARHAQPSATSAVRGKRSRSSNEDEVKVDETFEDNGRNKRCRGRPRLDTKDETAADRRRTQIRLAQRAYRHRKDAAIATLENRVKELERANRDISKDFNVFFSILVSERVLDGAPDALNRLASIANKITATADKARASNGNSSPFDDDDDEVNASNASCSGRQSSCLHSPSAPCNSSSEPSPAQGTLQQQAPSQQANYPTAYGVPVTVPTVANTTVAPFSAPPDHVPPSVNYELLTAATPHDASFSIYSSMEPGTAAESGGNMANAPWPYAALPAPPSFAAYEQTFGRRLQRNTTESALRLIMSSNPPPDRFAAVFGFCLFFETREDIIRRLQAALNSSQYEDLCHWRFPFTNLGGAGTFFPDQSPMRSPDSASFSSMPIGNQGTQSYGKPREMTGMSMGPWGPAVQATRDERIDYGADRRMQMMLAGFEGDFFDPDEVETHLRQLGIFISQRADFVHTEIDIHILEEHEDVPEFNSTAAQPLQSFCGSADSAHQSTAVWTTSRHSDSSASGAVELPCPANNPPMAKYPPMAQGQHAFSGPGPGPGPAPAPVPGSSGNGFGTTAPPSYVVTPPADNRVWPQPVNWPNKVKITLDVDVLIRELTRKSVCLGRSPGVRRKDISAAIKVAAGLVAGPG